MSLVTPQIRASASEISHGNANCQEKIKFMLKEMELPNNFLPIKDVEECGYVKDTGFVWIRQKKPSKYYFEKIGKVSSYATEVTAIMKKGKISNITGVKSKEFLVWIPLSEATINDPKPGKITFWVTESLHRSYPMSAFEIDDVKEDVGSVSVANDAQVKEV